LLEGEKRGEERGEARGKKEGQISLLAKQIPVKFNSRSSEESGLLSSLKIPLRGAGVCLFRVLRTHPLIPSQEGNI